LVISDLMPTTSDLVERLCRLETDDGKNVLIAQKAVLNGKSAIEFYFDFKSGQHLETDRCYYLKCPHPQSPQRSWFNDDDVD
jgi:hypothetical protein